jgi:alkylated DNA repair dioxygenase AlkB
MEPIIKTDKSFLSIYKIEEYNQLIANCIEEIKNELIENPKIIIYGKPAIQHRCIGFFSNDSVGYYYSGQLAKSKPLYTNLFILINKINTQFNTSFNGILVNKYVDGNDYIGAHSDDESYLDIGGVVAISYGAIRTFRIRNKKDKKKIMDIPTDSNSIFHMGGHFQKEFTHEIPIEKKIKDTRYSLTFRKHSK